MSVHLKERLCILGFVGWSWWVGDHHLGEEVAGWVACGSSSSGGHHGGSTPGEHSGIDVGQLHQLRAALVKTAGTFRGQRQWVSAVAAAGTLVVKAAGILLLLFSSAGVVRATRDPLGAGVCSTGVHRVAAGPRPGAWACANRQWCHDRYSKHFWVWIFFPVYIIIQSTSLRNAGIGNYSLHRWRDTYSLCPI